MSRLKMDLLIIDPQNDFTDKPFPRADGSMKPGSLAVVGAWEDMKRLSTFVDRVGGRLRDIHVTMDCHRTFDVAHPLWWKAGDLKWRNSKNDVHPDPFTMIVPQDLLPGGPNQPAKWIPALPYPEKYTKAGFTALSYLEKLAATNRYPLVIWPEHCLIGDTGNAINSEIFEALNRWERNETADIDWVSKGSNVYTEHYSAVRAEVPDPFDPSTTLNKRLIDMLAECDVVLLAGEARSHCLANTVRDIAAEFGDANIRKLILLEDCTSDVGGFEQMGKDFVTEMTARGMQVVKSVDYS